MVNSFKSTGNRMGIVSLILALAVSVGAAGSSANADLVQAHKLYEGRRFREALAAYQSVRQTYPGTREAAVALYYSGLAHERMGSRQAALDAYREMENRHKNSDLLGAAKQRAMEVEQDMKKNPSAAPAGSGTPGGGLSQGVMDQLMERAVEPVAVSVPVAKKPSVQKPSPSAQVKSSVQWPEIPGARSDGAIVPEPSSRDAWPDEPPQGVRSVVFKDAVSGKKAEKSARAEVDAATARASGAPPSMAPEFVSIPVGRGTATAVTRHVPSPEEVLAIGGTSDGDDEYAAAGLRSQQSSAERTPSDAGAIAMPYSPESVLSSNLFREGAEPVAPEKEPAVERVAAPPAPAPVEIQVDTETAPDLLAPIDLDALPDLRGSNAPSTSDAEMTAPGVPDPTEGEEARSISVSEPAGPAPFPIVITEIASSRLDTEALAPAPSLSLPMLPAAPDAVAALSPAAVENWEPRPVLDLGSPAWNLVEPARVSPVDVREERGAAVTPVASPMMMDLPEAAAVPTTPDTSELDLWMRNFERASAAPASAAEPAAVEKPRLPLPRFGISLDEVRGALQKEAEALSASSPKEPTAPARAAGKTPASTGINTVEQRILRAIRFRQNGMDDKAIEEYRQALAIDPVNPVVKNNLADIYIARKENLTEAIELLNEALAVEPPDKGPYYSTLGWAYASLEDYERAESYLNAALQSRMTAERLYRRGMIYRSMGLATRARADLEKALVYAEDEATRSMIRRGQAELAESGQSDKGSPETGR